ncbi:type II secretion system protein [Candidatus Sumerlaeota bacterium]|nr:type II secretion system protein [Candidatus Sumerlaeota bacterium]
MPQRQKPAAFVLLEVVISLTILAVTVTAILRSFSQSFSAARQLEARTQAVFFAQQLLDEFEINPPPEGTREGGFGEAYKEYSYMLKVEYEEPKYRANVFSREVEQFYPLRTLTLDIYYNNGRNKEFRALTLHSAVIGFERFSEQAKAQMQNL